MNGKDNSDSYIKVSTPKLSATIDNSKFETLVIKTFNLKQKTNQIPLDTIEKNQILSLQKNNLVC